MILITERRTTEETFSKKKKSLKGFATRISASQFLVVLIRLLSKQRVEGHSYSISN